MYSGPFPPMTFRVLVIETTVNRIVGIGKLFSPLLEGEGETASRLVKAGSALQLRRRVFPRASQ